LSSQAIPTTGVALGIRYREVTGLDRPKVGEAPVVVCSLGDGSVTEGEVAEAFQMAVLKQLPILYFIQDNEWDISANAREIRAMDANEYAKGFKGLEVRTIDGTDFFAAYNTLS
jgi:2-oxoisovalerate dehydrogenase E1 component